MISPAALVQLLPLSLVPPAAAESGAVLGSNSADGWAWPPFLENFLGPAMILAGMTLVILISLKIKRRNRELADLGRRPTREPSVRPLAASEREAIERMAVDLEEVARTISAMLDTRMRTLEKLIRDADERIARLGGSPGPAGDGGESAGDPAPPSGDSGAAARTLEHHAHIYGLADQGLSVHEIAEQTGYQEGEVELVLSLRKAAGSDGR